MRDPRRAVISPSALGFNEENMLLGDAPGRYLAEPANDPAHRIFVLLKRPCRPAQLDLSIPEKIGHELAERRLTVRIIRYRDDWDTHIYGDQGPRSIYGKPLLSGKNRAADCN